MLPLYLSSFHVRINENLESRIAFSIHDFSDTLGRYLMLVKTPSGDDLHELHDNPP